jgi:branched-chain amino acid transport system permease protein
VAIQWLTTQIGTQQTFNSNLVLGAILVVFVLLVPRGVVPSIGLMVERLMIWRKNKPASAPTGSVPPALATEERPS